MPTAVWEAAGYPSVGAAEGAAAPVNAMDPQTPSAAAGGREAAVETEAARSHLPFVHKYSHSRTMCWALVEGCVDFEPEERFSHAKFPT